MCYCWSDCVSIIVCILVCAFLLLEWPCFYKYPTAFVECAFLLLAWSCNKQPYTFLNALGSLVCDFIHIARVGHVGLELP